MTTEATSAPETTPKISEVRALLEDPSLHKIYVGNVPYSATVDDLKSYLTPAGQAVKVIIASRYGRSLGYAFAAFKKESEAEKAIADLNKKELQGRELSIEKVIRKTQEELEQARENRRARGRGRGRGRGGRSNGNPRSVSPQGKNTVSPKKEAAKRIDDDEEESRNVSARGRGRGRGGRGGRGRGGRANREPREPREPGAPSDNVLFVGNLPWKVNEEALKSIFAEYNPVSAHIVTQYSGRSRGFGFVEVKNNQVQKQVLSELQNITVDGRELFGGLAPVPFCGKILQDFGAFVIKVDKLFPNAMDVFADTKSQLLCDIRKGSVQSLILQKIIPKVDVLLDPYRPGVMEKLGLGPNVVLNINPRIIYARLTGYGQHGSFAKMAGHDINYVALTGILSAIGRKETPAFPANILGDFAGGGLLCAFGIMVALFERTRSGKGQVIDSAMVDGVSYLSSFIFSYMKLGWWNNERGMNLLDSGAPFYDIYKTKDVNGCLEAPFYKEFIKGLGLDISQLPDRDDSANWPELRSIFKDILSSKTRDEWTDIFKGTDACVAPVLEFKDPNECGKDVMSLEHHQQRQQLERREGSWHPRPAPRLSRTPAKRNDYPIKSTRDILIDFGVSLAELDQLVNEKAIRVPSVKEMSKL